MKKIPLILFITVSTIISFGQSNYIRLNLLDTHKLIVNQGFGLTLSRTDYNNIGIGSNFNFGGEYYLKQFNFGLIGIKLYYGSLSVKGEDEYKTPSSFRTDVDVIGIGPTHSIRLDSLLYLFSSAGFTFTWFDPRGSDGSRLPNNKNNMYDRFTIDYYLQSALRYRISDNWLISIDGILYINDNDLIDDNDDYVFADFYGSLNLGISYAFNLSNDSDQDGVVDDWDRCPNTPLNIEVNDSGCPKDEDYDGIPDYRDACLGTELGVEVDKFGCAFDTDKDGVADFFDECPDTPAGVLVTDNGCPIDTDADGVPDYIDLCPDTEVGVQVDSSGCYKMDETRDFLESVRIYFDSGSAELSDEAKEALDKLSHFIKNYSNITWYIEGHMDNLETRHETQETISHARMNAVFDYFILHDLPVSRFRLVDRKDKFAVGDNRTVSGRAENRRVVIFGIK